MVRVEDVGGYFDLARECRWWGGEQKARSRSCRRETGDVVKEAGDRFRKTTTTAQFHAARERDGKDGTRAF